MTHWILPKANMHEYKRASAKRKKDKYNHTGKAHQAHYCKVCGQEIRGGSLCNSCAQFLQSKRETEAMQ